MGLYHRLVARLLTNRLLVEDWARIVVELSKRNLIPLQALSKGWRPHEDFYFWPLTICATCSTITENPQTIGPVSVVCPNCTELSTEYRTKLYWPVERINHELNRLPKTHKKQIVEAIRYGKYIRTNNGNIANAGQCSNNLGQRRLE